MSGRRTGSEQSRHESRPRRTVVSARAAGKWAVDAPSFLNDCSARSGLMPSSRSAGWNPRPTTKLCRKRSSMRGRIAGLVQLSSENIAYAGPLADYALEQAGAIGKCTRPPKPGVVSELMASGSKNSDSLRIRPFATSSCVPEYQRAVPLAAASRTCVDADPR